MADLAATSNQHSSQAIDGSARTYARLAAQVLLVGLVCHLSAEIGFAHKLPPHNISALWPLSAILFSVLVLTPVRHWWLYTAAAYLPSIAKDAAAGFSLAALWFILAGVFEILLAAVCVRRFAGGAAAFDRLRTQIIYLLSAVLCAPALSAFIAALASPSADYWFFWRAWFFSEALAFLMLAPALLTCIAKAPALFKGVARVPWLEMSLIVAGLLAVSIRTFAWPEAGHAGSVPVLVYLPLPHLLWAAVRLGPAGLHVCLLAIASVSITGMVHGRGPFATGAPSDNALSLQLFLIAMSIPLMFLAALIEEGRQKTKVLSESEARFRTMADTAPVMIWMSAMDKGCNYFNKPWLAFTGRLLEQELGDGWVEGVHPQDLERCLNTYGSAFDARTPFEMEYRLRRHDGDYRWIIDCGVPRTAADGTFIGYIGSCLDITDRKRAQHDLQEQRRELAHLSRVAVLGELSGALAHELNQPLTAILSNAQAAQRFLAQGTPAQAPPHLEEVRDILGDIVAENKRAGEVIRRLRTMLKKGDTQFQALDVNEIASETLALAHADILARGISVRCELAPGAGSVSGDRVQLQQVLLNLIVNGCDAMQANDPAERRLTISSKNGDGMVRLAVADCGCGIPADKLDRLFEAFYTTKEHGLGLGLTICRSIVAAHGGQLLASNNPGRGATFCLALPAQNGDHA